MPQPNIFINYRRSDTEGFAIALYGDLNQKYPGQIFVDRMTLEVGRKYESDIERSLADCAILIVLIGPNWLSVQNKDGHPRLFDTKDILRAEIAVALKRSVPVIPLLVGHVPMPARADLPPEIVELADYNATHLYADDWPSSITRLCRTIDARLAESAAATENKSAPQQPPTPQPVVVSPPPIAAVAAPKLAPQPPASKIESLSTPQPKFPERRNPALLSSIAAKPNLWYVLSVAAVLIVAAIIVYAVHKKSSRPSTTYQPWISSPTPSSSASTPNANTVTHSPSIDPKSTTPKASDSGGSFYDSIVDSIKTKTDPLNWAAQDFSQLKNPPSAAKRPMIDFYKAKTVLDLAYNQARYGRQSDWRIPTREELATICGPQADHANYERTFGPSGPSTLYWSSTTDYRAVVMNCKTGKSFVADDNATIGHPSDPSTIPTLRPVRGHLQSAPVAAPASPPH